MQELYRDVIPKCLFRFRCNDGVKSCCVSVSAPCSVARILSIGMIAECSVRLSAAGLLLFGVQKSSQRWIFTQFEQ